MISCGLAVNYFASFNWFYYSQQILKGFHDWVYLKAFTHDWTTHRNILCDVRYFRRNLRHLFFFQLPPAERTPRLLCRLCSLPQYFLFVRNCVHLVFEQPSLLVNHTCLSEYVPVVVYYLFNILFNDFTGLVVMMMTTIIIVCWLFIFFFCCLLLPTLATWHRIWTTTGVNGVQQLAKRRKERTFS